MSTRASSSSNSQLRLRANRKKETANGDLPVRLDVGGGAQGANWNGLPSLSFGIIKPPITKIGWGFLPLLLPGDLLLNLLDSTDRWTTSLARVTPRPPVRINRWRVMNTLILVCLGAAKAVLVHKGQSGAPNTLDWIIGILFATIAFWGTIVEAERPNAFPWLFEEDCGFLRQIPTMVAAVLIMTILVWPTIFFYHFIGDRIDLSFSSRLAFDFMDIIIFPLCMMLTSTLIAICIIVVGWTVFFLSRFLVAVYETLVRFYRRPRKQQSAASMLVLFMKEWLFLFSLSINVIVIVWLYSTLPDLEHPMTFKDHSRSEAKLDIMTCVVYITIWISVDFSSRLTANFRISQKLVSVVSDMDSDILQTRFAMPANLPQIPPPAILVRRRDSIEPRLPRMSSRNSNLPTHFPMPVNLPTQITLPAITRRRRGPIEPLLPQIASPNGDLQTHFSTPVNLPQIPLPAIMRRRRGRIEPLLPRFSSREGDPPLSHPLCPQTQGCSVRSEVEHRQLETGVGDKQNFDDLRGSRQSWATRKSRGTGVLGVVALHFPRTPQPRP